MTNDVTSHLLAWVPARGKGTHFMVVPACQFLIVEVMEDVEQSMGPSFHL
jgi:hypothetical protein